VLPPVIYLLAVLSIGAFLYYRDAQTIDAHLSRANHARLLGQHDKTIKEYRAALTLEENAHTRNLLGVELVNAGQMEEALAEFRAAERGGEPDDQLFYRIATTLDALNRPAEAVPEYRKFLGTRLCTESYPDPQCEAARARVAVSDKLES
jgi:tetratricopeptide (TPR) repeat protein